MAKPLVDFETVLFPREDQDHIQSAQTVLRDLIEKHPEGATMRCSMRLEEYEDGRVRLKIIIKDPYMLSVKAALFWLFLFAVFIWYTYTP